MAIYLVIAITAFLAGAATAVFTMLVIGIRKADRPHILPPASTPLDAVTRSALRAGTWPDGLLSATAKPTDQRSQARSSSRLRGTLAAPEFFFSGISDGASSR